ncbi:hypothetical protein N0B16_04945 [Chryseobacterium sp. GMJ5]|uniref:Uncharacterized protein n=1 Tax=Chryseobacterium gilvum TaxID=2976534 RepID=A0ABT2VVZ2_9FLAO|nr:hypothetical protein [Chryseobacterium gilvum]MCU7613778.1 hypothetical protein [Chryseobacterium gilvum]
MKNIQIVGFILVVIGSFLPLVHVPVIGNWNYWKIDYYLAGACWFFSVCTLFSILNNRQNLVKIFGILLLILFAFTLFAVKYKSLSYFSFLPFRSWTEAIAGTIKLKWGWFVEFAGALMLIIAKKKAI